jgi:PAP2 superfamily protein
MLTTVILPATYLFFGLVAMFAANDLIASLKFLGAYDHSFLSADAFLLHGHSISGLAHAVLPHFVWSAAEFIYYGMFAQIGAALILVALLDGRRAASRYAGTIIAAYVLAIVIFYLWPSMGPFYTCPDHFSHFPTWLSTYEIQQTAIQKAKLLSSSYRYFNTITIDYFIAFPCMHIAQPLVVLWSCRRWRRIAVVLIAYDLMLLPAILFLEWHYLVDVIAGVAVAMAAVAITICGVGWQRSMDY